MNRVKNDLCCEKINKVWTEFSAIIGIGERTAGEQAAPTLLQIGTGSGRIRVSGVGESSGDFFFGLVTRIPALRIRSPRLRCPSLSQASHALFALPPKANVVIRFRMGDEEPVCRIDHCQPPPRSFPSPAEAIAAASAAAMQHGNSALRPPTTRMDHRTADRHATHAEWDA